ncbi:MAG TPA: SRPBCC domain-containing protein [Ohtaekwangia sp.]|uniref:SRPBCC family protein n=1 Tax=Ohtaekwangia sp. TaxID=2066019 RepID=UPI002F929736
MKQFFRSIAINAPSAIVWKALTEPELMKQWMAEPEINLEIITNWKIGGPIITRGFHHVAFENKGTVLQVVPEKVLQYNYLSSLSQLPDTPEHYSVIDFRLVAEQGKTIITVMINNFPTETIYKHVVLYWEGTIIALKDTIGKEFAFP